MKKFLLKVLLPTIIIVLTLFVGLEIYIRSLPNDFKEKNQYLESNAKRLKIMVLGDSGASMDIMPGCFDLQPAYNFAYHAQNIDYSYWILSKRFEVLDSLGYVIINYGYGTLWGFDKHPLSQGRKKFYKIYWGYPIETFSLEMFSSPMEILHRIWPNNAQQAMHTIDLYGYQGDYYKDIPFDEEMWLTSTEATIESWYEKINDESKYNENVRTLRGIIEKCRGKGVCVILVITPTLKMFYENMNPAPMEKMLALSDSLRKDYDNVILLDYFKSDSLFPSNEMWYNSTHLNKKGAKKFSLLLNDTIMKMKYSR